MIRTKAGIFSLTAAAPDNDPVDPLDQHGSYLRWHLLDHMPEQYQLPGIVFGLRWPPSSSSVGYRQPCDPYSPDP